MDQTAPKDQVLLGNVRKCREDTDLFGNSYLLHGNHNGKKTGPGPDYLRNPTGIGYIPTGQNTCK